MKRRSRSAAIRWNTLLRYAITEEMSDICNELCDMIADVQNKSNKLTSVDARTMEMALKLASDGGYQLNNEEKTVVERQFREVRRPANIPLMGSEILFEMVGSDVSSYPSSGDEIEYISSAEPLTPISLLLQPRCPHPPMLGESR